MLDTVDTTNSFMVPLECGLIHALCLPWAGHLCPAVMCWPLLLPCSARSLPLLSPQANLSATTLTQTTASTPAQSSAPVTKSSGGAVKVGSVTLSPGMTLTQKHIQHLQQIMLHAQQLAASHKSQGGASKLPPGVYAHTVLPHWPVEAQSINHSMSVSSPMWEVAQVASTDRTMYSY